MPDLTLKDILIGARRESYQMRHNYIGVEHLFIAMLEMKGGLTGSVLLENGIQPDYMIDAMRRKMGKGGKHRLWVGMPQTPRAERILESARKLAVKSGRTEVNERDLLVAILRESDNFPVRVLTALGIENSDALLQMAQTYNTRRDSARPFIAIEYGKDFDRTAAPSNELLLILRRLFHDYAYIRVERYLKGGYSNAELLIVTPLTIDRREDAAVVVKIDQVDAIMDEAQRYETYVKSRLPPLTARLEDRPVAPETSDLAGLKYTLVTADDQTPKDLRSMYSKWTGAQIGEWLRNALFPSFGRHWWQHNRSYRFQVWQEYDWLLPPLYTLELIEDDPPPTSAITLRIPIRRSKLHGIEYGDVVTVENFLVQSLDETKKSIRLAAGHGTDASRAYEIEVRGINFDEATYYRGEVVESLTGSVWKTREELLAQAVRALEPDFDCEGETIAVKDFSPERLPNPIYAFNPLLDNYLNGTVSTIHGDLHPGNIMIGPNDSAFLIDFAHARDGHTIFDWVTLEISLLSDFVLPTIGEDWDAVREALSAYAQLNAQTNNDNFRGAVHSAMAALVPVRQTAKFLLAEGRWSEYFTPLVFCALRAITWNTMPIPSRRLMYLIAGLAIHDLAGRLYIPTDSATPTPDETNTNPNQ